MVPPQYAPDIYIYIPRYETRVRIHTNFEAVYGGKIYINEVNIIQEKVFIIFLLPNKKEWKLKIFRREGFDEYLCAVFIKKY